jgi:Transposase
LIPRLLRSRRAHKETVVACLRLIDDKVARVRTFETTTASLMTLSDWLTEHKCTHIAIEATSVYWKLVWHILADGDFQLVLAHAAHVKIVPGRKTDVSGRALSRTPRHRTCALCCARAKRSGST